MSTRNNIAIIVAAGRGSRLRGPAGENTPKQYLMLGERSILAHTIAAFMVHDNIDAVQCVIHEDDAQAYAEAMQVLDQNPKLRAPVVGGTSRQESVWLGLKAVATEAPTSKVLIHDAARPFVSKKLITNVLATADTNICALPACALSDTIKRAGDNGEVAETVDRATLHAAQTPQGFMLAEILEAHDLAQSSGRTDFTDDASLYEADSKRVKLVDGDPANFKITTLSDLERARAMIGNPAASTSMPNVIPDMRTGTGYDVHAFEDGDAVTLCGVEIAHTRKLKGHSDADVGLHALTDAILGTMGVGDIGTFFPPSDDKWKDANSELFLKAACDLVRERGGTICNLDVCLICEAPKIGPHREAMNQRIAQICDIAIERVSTKATTNERLGFLGREEGIAATASASIFYGYFNPSGIPDNEPGA